jgi:AAA+ ATPase superfamily predicted ATPase
MEEQTLSESGPLHNRRTGQLRLEALSYRDAALFYPNYSAEDRIAAYAIWGGLPSYLEEFDPDVPVWQNVRDRILRLGARLAEEPRWLRFSDLRSDALYASILRTIAQGERRPGKIAQAVGRSRADDVAYQLERLCEMGLVQRVVPVTEAGTSRSRQALYVLADHYVAFWYRFVDRLRHLLAMRRYDETLAAIQEDFDRYVSERAFEDACRQFLWEALASDHLPAQLQFDHVGSWWIARDEVQDEVDVVAMRSGRTVLVGECKWSNQPCGTRELEGLNAALHKGNRDLRPIDRPWRALFSRSGFTEDLRVWAADPEDRVLLFTPSDLYL